MKKRLIALLLAGTMAVSLAACGPDNSNPSDSVSNGSSEDVQQSTPSESTPEESTPETTPAPEAQGYSEAPMLADLVQGGTLPKLEDRLPAEIGRAHV